MYYDRSKPVTVQTDAREYGLGTALIQSSIPIAFASKTLTDAETDYVNNERVSVSVLWPQEVSHIPIWQACDCTE